MDNNFSDILDIFKKLDEGNEFAGQAHGQKPGDQWRGTDAGTPGTKLVGECDAPMSLADKLRARWEETKRTKGLQEYGSIGATGSIPPAGAGGLPPPSGSTNTADQAKQKADIQKNLQGIPGIDANKAVTDLTDPKDVSGLNVALANALKDPATAQKAKELLAKGMQQGGVQ